MQPVRDNNLVSLWLRERVDVVSKVMDLRRQLLSFLYIEQAMVSSVSNVGMALPSILLPSRVQDSTTVTSAPPALD